jgi:hypothetical protein
VNTLVPLVKLKGDFFRLKALLSIFVKVEAWNKAEREYGEVDGPLPMKLARIRKILSQFFQIRV